MDKIEYHFFFCLKINLLNVRDTVILMIETIIAHWLPDSVLCAYSINI